MQKNEIHTLIDNKYNALFTFLQKHDDNKWNQGPPSKWTTGQHIVHLNQSAKPLNKALGLPKFLLRYKFGKPNRAPRSYEEIINKYLDKLSVIDSEVLSPYSKNMVATPPNTKKEIIQTLENNRKTLHKRLSKLSEEQLDKYLLPHPLMGKMMLREVIMWTAFHVEHHHKTLLDKY